MSMFSAEMLDTTTPNVMYPFEEIDDDDIVVEEVSGMISR